jgi:hypothetical protein
MIAQAGLLEWIALKREGEGIGKGKGGELVGRTRTGKSGVVGVAESSVTQRFRTDEVYVAWRDD